MVEDIERCANTGIFAQAHIIRAIAPLLACQVPDYVYRNKLTSKAVPAPVTASLNVNSMIDKALELIERISRLSIAERVVDVMASSFEEVGANIMLVTRAEPGQKLQAEILASRAPAKFFQLYSARKYVRHSPVVRRARRSLEPFFWNVETLLSESDPYALEIGRLVEQFGIRGGFMIPVHGPDGLKGGVSIMGPRVQVSRHDAPAVHLLGHYGFIRMHKLMKQQPRAKLVLTGREREVLAWSARGMSAMETAEILRIKRRTVEQHVQNICRKLAARNRTQAVALAIRDGLIKL